MPDPNSSVSAASSGASPTGNPPSQTAGGSNASGIDQSSHRGSGIVNRVRETATAQLTNQKDRATDGLGSVAEFVRQSTQQLRDQKHDAVAGYVEQAAEQIDKLSQRLREKDVPELVQDVQRLARKQPAVFVGGAFALGLLGARFLKSSGQDRREAADRSYRTGPTGSSRAYAGGYRGTASGPSAGQYGASDAGQYGGTPTSDSDVLRAGDAGTASAGSTTTGSATRAGAGASGRPAAAGGPSRPRRSNPQNERS